MVNYVLYARFMNHYMMLGSLKRSKFENNTGQKIISLLEIQTIIFTLNSRSFGSAWEVSYLKQI